MPVNTDPLTDNSFSLLSNLGYKPTQKRSLMLRQENLNVRFQLPLNLYFKKTVLNR